MSTTSVELTHLFISPGHNYYGRHGKGSENHEILGREKIECVAGRGLLDDRFFDYKEDYKGQITLFDYSTYERVMREFALPDLQPSAFRRNVVVKGADLNELIGKDFTLGVIELSGSEEAKPCTWGGEVLARVWRIAMPNQNQWQFDQGNPAPQNPLRDGLGRNALRNVG